MRKCCALAQNASRRSRSEPLSKQEQRGMRVVAEYRVNRRERGELPQRSQTRFLSFSLRSLRNILREPLRLTIFDSTGTTNCELEPKAENCFRPCLSPASSFPIFPWKRCCALSLSCDRKQSPFSKENPRCRR